MPRAQQPERATPEDALRAAEARVAASLDQLLRDHAEWARLKREAERPTKDEPQMDEAPAPAKAPAKARAPKKAKAASAPAAVPTPTPAPAPAKIAAPTPPPAPKKAATRKPAVAAAAASPAPSASAAPKPAAPKPRKAPRAKKGASPHERARMRALNEARRKMEEMGVKPWKPKKPAAAPKGKAPLA